VQIQPAAVFLFRNVLTKYTALQIVETLQMC